jgi:hypothetical protein
MADLREIETLIEAHINAKAEHDRLFALNDQDLAPQQAVSDALEPLDAALIAICAARPSDKDAAARRSEYLNAKAWDSIDCCEGLGKEVIAALVGAAWEAQP